MDEGNELEQALDALREILYREAKMDALASFDCRMTVMASLLVTLEEKSPRQFRAACRLFSGQTIAQIAKEMHCSRQAVSELLDRAQRVIPQIARLRARLDLPEGAPPPPCPPPEGVEEGRGGSRGVEGPSPTPPGRRFGPHLGKFESFENKEFGLKV